jgi:hypothetical protein
VLEDSSRASFQNIMQHSNLENGRSPKKNITSVMHTGLQGRLALLTGFWWFSSVLPQYDRIVQVQLNP